MSKNIKDITYLTPREKKDYLETIREDERDLTESKTSEYHSVRNRDTNLLRKNITKNKKVLEEKSAPIVSDREKDDRYKRAKFLEEEIRKGMPTKDEMMGNRIKNPDGSFHYVADPKIVDRHIEWTKRTEPLVREWKRIKRTLEPDDPSITNVEQLRNLH